MSVQTSYLTKLRAQELEGELKYLQEVKEPELANKIKDAREMGRLENNPDFDIYIEQQSLVTTRIREIEFLLCNSQIITSTKKQSKVSVGSTVIVEVEGRNDSFTIVGVSEAAPHQGKISHESPVGKALIGASVGQEIFVETEIYSTIYRVIDIKHG